MPYIGKAPSSGIRSRFIYTATAAQTTFTGADGTGKTLGYTDGEYVDVYLNGVLLDPADYTATSKTSVVLDSGATVSDIVEIVVYDTFSVFNGTFTGDLTVDGDTLVVDSTNNNVFVGKSSSDIGTAGIELQGGNDRIFVTRSGDSTLYLNRTTSDGSIQEFLKDGTTVGSIGSFASGNRLYFAGGNSALTVLTNEIYPATNTGAASDNTIQLGSSGARFSDLYLGGNLYLGGTGSANALDDYEEGTWTPRYTGSSSNPSVTYDEQHGFYVKIGSQVIARLELHTDAVSGGSGNCLIEGLPFTPAARNGNRAGSLIVGYSSSFAGDAPQGGYINDANAQIILATTNSGNAGSNMDHTILISDLGTTPNDNFLMATLIYET